ncbi:MAG: substrate-binding domain-containing protein, partial [Bacilli bacterium]|nr:substrate-binding domain-containing protein [Bacilli bacterium]
LNRILASNVDGIISLVPVTKNAAIFNENWRKPIVQVGSPSKETGVDSIYSDDLSGAKELTKALLSKGHRQIGFISSAPDMIPGLRRIKGYLDALEEAGKPYGESYVHYLTPSSLTVEGATQNLVKRGCDAIIYFNDLSALMGKRFLETIHRPDVGVAGFDGIERYTPTASHIPSAHLDLEKMAEEAVDVLLLRLKGEEFPPVDKMLPVSVHT